MCVSFIRWYVSNQLPQLTHRSHIRDCAPVHCTNGGQGISRSSAVSMQGQSWIITWIPLRGRFLWGDAFRHHVNLSGRNHTVFFNHAVYGTKLSFPGHTAKKNRLHNDRDKKNAVSCMRVCDLRDIKKPEESIPLTPTSSCSPRLLRKLSQSPQGIVCLASRKRR